MTTESSTAQSPSDPNRATPGGLTTEQADACARRLAALVRRINGFLGSQLTKIERTCRHLEKESANYAEWEQMSRELKEQQALWEEKQADDAEKIAEQLELLTAAWDGIEAERRSLLTDNGDAPTIAAVPIVEPPEAAAQAVPALPNNLNFLDFESTVTGRSAALQFQQIKREIRQHARRNPS